MSGTITVLFLAADPHGSRSGLHLRLDREAREIQHALWNGRERDTLTFVSEWAVRTRDLQAALLRHRPQVVHFAGHGSGSRGIFLEDDAGEPRAVGRDALAGLFGILKPSVRVVLLNACESLPAVDAFSGAVDYCIGMNSRISDEAALTFSAGFYGALAYGRPPDDAFAFGVNRLQLEGIPGSAIPVLRVRPGADPGPVALSDPDPPVHEEEMHYLRTVVSRLDALELFGGRGDDGDDDGAGGGRMHISELFTQPLLTLTRAGGQAVAEALRAGPGATPARDGEERIRVEAVEAFAGAPRLVVLGDPGDGKSVLLGHLAVQLALRRLGEPAAELPGWEDGDAPLPVVVLLRELAGWLAGRAGAENGAPQAGWVWDYLAHLLESWGCAGARSLVSQAIHDGRAAVFFDGLDEVTETEERPWRTRIARALEAFADPLPAGRIVVTCRRYAYGRGEPWRLPDAGFPVVELDRFNLGQVRAFALRWYRSVGAQRGWDAGESRRRALQLYEQVKASANLRDLAGSPLLLTLMARIHREAQALPDDRAQLYDRAIDLLLAEWENRKDAGWRGGEHVVARLAVPTAGLRAALAGLAFDAHAASARLGEEGAATLREHELLYCLRTVAGGLDRAEAFIDYIRTRAGLLVLRADRTYAFPHRTFQEYLAATHLLSRPDFAEVLLQQAHGDFTWWREVFFLAAASLAREPERLAVLADAVLAEVEDAPPREVLVQAAAFVALPMASGPFVPAAAQVKRYARLVSRMQAVLAGSMVAEDALTAPVRAEAGFALARIGDPREEVRSVDVMPFRPVPAGPFWMGSAAGDPSAYPEEVPLHPLDLPYDYWMGRFPVTVAQFRAFATAEGRPPPAPDPLAADSLPAAVSWHDALAFCRWLTARLRAEAPRALARPGLDPAERAFWTGLGDGRLAATLPSEAEWEKAVRGPEGHRAFPWGDGADANRANYQDAAIGRPSVVGCFPGGASPLGLEEASGNVWEWTRSLWGEDEQVPSFGYPYDAADGREALEAAPGVRRVLRGGGFHSPERSIRAASRFGLPPAVVSPNCGFRVAVVPGSPARDAGADGAE